MASRNSTQLSTLSYFTYSSTYIRSVITSSSNHFSVAADLSVSGPVGTRGGNQQHRSKWTSRTQVSCHRCIWRLDDHPNSCPCEQLRSGWFVKSSKLMSVSTQDRIRDWSGVMLELTFKYVGHHKGFVVRPPFHLSCYVQRFCPTSN